jgi:hypothetical protein
MGALAPNYKQKQCDNIVSPDKNKQGNFAPLRDTKKSSFILEFARNAHAERTVTP